MEKNLQKLRNASGGVFLLVIGIIYLSQIGKIANRASYYYNSHFIPLILGWVLVGLSVIEILRNVIPSKKTREASRRDEIKKAPLVKKGSMGKVLISLLLMTLYVVLMNKVGFIIMTFLFFMGEMYLLSPKDNKKIWMIVLLSIVFTAMIEIVFYYWLNIIIPQGIIKI